MKKDQGKKKKEKQADDNLLVKLELRSNPLMLCVVRSLIERFAEVLEFSDHETRSITRAVDEALTNVIRHSYGGDLNKRIEVHCRPVKGQSNTEHRDGLEILLCDHGRAFDPAKLPARPLDELRPGGLGLHLIRQSLDMVQYSRVAGTNRLRLVKFHSPSVRDQKL